MDFHDSRRRIEERYPIYQSTSAERTALFGPAPSWRASHPRHPEFRSRIVA
jgi:hypothetical protein